MEVSASHSLNLSYRSKMREFAWSQIGLLQFIAVRVLNADGMVVDFTHIKRAVMGRLDHQKSRMRYFILILQPKILHIGFVSKYPLFKVEVVNREG